MAHMEAIVNGFGLWIVAAVLPLLPFGEVGKRRSGGFSLGMGQRLGIAGALLGDPEVIMLDEPVNGLDPEGILWIRHLLQDLADQGRTVFVSSHLMSEMELMAEHFVIIGGGKLIKDISADDLRAMAQSDETSVRADRMSDLVSVLRGDGVEISSTDRETVSVRGIDAPAIGRLALENGIALSSLVPETRTLEDVFMSLTADSVEYHGSTTRTEEGRTAEEAMVAA